MGDSTDDQYKRRSEDNRTYFQRWVPHPLLTLVLILLWMALLNKFSPGGLFVAIVLGMVIPIYTANFWPERPTIRSPIRALIFVVIILFDIVVANIQVAYLILFRRSDQLRPGWITIPMELTNSEAITVFTATITLTPGTVASDLSADGTCLLVHCLDIDDEQAMVRQIKHRYERRIKAIFP